MPNFRVTVCSGVFDIEASDIDEAIDEALSQSDYEVVELEDEEDDDEEDDDGELDDEDEEEEDDEDD